MIQATSHQTALQSRTYQVRLGHVQVDVQAANIGEALQIARQRLSAEYPRLWDMIHAAADARFVVEPVE